MGYLLNKTTLKRKYFASFGIICILNSSYFPLNSSSTAFSSVTQSLFSVSDPEMLSYQATLPHCIKLQFKFYIIRIQTFSSSALLESKAHFAPSGAAHL